MHACMHVCMYVCMYVCMCVCMCTYVHVYLLRVHIHRYLHVLVRTCMHPNVQMCVYKYMPVHSSLILPVQNCVACALTANVTGASIYKNFTLCVGSPSFCISAQQVSNPQPQSSGTYTLPQILNPALKPLEKVPGNAFLALGFDTAQQFEVVWCRFRDQCAGYYEAF